GARRFAGGAWGGIKRRGVPARRPGGPHARTVSTEYIETELVRDVAVAGAVGDCGGLDPVARRQRREVPVLQRSDPALQQRGHVDVVSAGDRRPEVAADPVD